MDRASDSAGFTVVELIVSAVIVSILLGAVYQVLVTNQRVSIVQREQIAGHQTVRAGIDLLSQELREVSASGGDLLVIDDGEVGFRALRAHGVACVVGSTANPVLRTATLTRPFEAGEALYVFADSDPETSADDLWLETTVQVATGGETCGTDGFPAQDLSVTGLTTTDWSAINQGAQIRSWEEVAYRTEEYGGALYLVQVQDETASRLVGPLAAGDGLHFEYLDEDGNATATPTDVRNVRVELRTTSAATTEQGTAVGDSLVTTVQLRN